MLAIVARLAVVVVGLAALGVVLWHPWAPSEEPPAPPAAAQSTLTDADGNIIADDGAFAPVPGFDPAAGGGDANHMVRYEMAPPTVVPPLPEGVTALTWADLWRDGSMTPIPAPDAERVGTPDASLFPEGSTAEDVANFFLDLGDMRAMQPEDGTIRHDLDGRRVRLAGYTTPVGFGEFETRFLLVPLLGACIHVPPPPPNQIVYVGASDPVPEMFAAVWVTGTLRAAPVATILADAGYRLEDVTVEPYR